jgi:hypothetical protein
MQDPKFVDEIVAALSNRDPDLVRQLLQDLDDAGYIVIGKIHFNAPVKKVFGDKTIQELARDFDKNNPNMLGYEYLEPPRFDALRDRPRPSIEGEQDRRG